MQPSTNTVNGVDRDALSATIDAINKDTGLAEFEFRLENEWVDGGYNKSTVRNFHGNNAEIDHLKPFVIYNDEPPVLLSKDQGPNPVENLLHALAGCLTTTLVYHAAANDMKVKSVRTRFEGDLDLRGFLGLTDKVRRGYRNIRAIFDIEGDLSAAQKKDLIEMAQRYSPVFDVVSNGVPVTCELSGERRAH